MDLLSGTGIGFERSWCLTSIRNPGSPQILSIEWHDAFALILVQGEAPNFGWLYPG